MVFNTKFNQSTYLNVKKKLIILVKWFTRAPPSAPPVPAAFSSLQPWTVSPFESGKSWFHEHRLYIWDRTDLKSASDCLPVSGTQLWLSSGIHPPAAWASCLRGSANQKNVGLNCEDKQLTWERRWTEIPRQVFLFMHERHAYLH